jgi:hypothetical protein
MPVTSKYVLESYPFQKINVIGEKYTISLSILADRKLQGWVSFICQNNPIKNEARLTHV